MYLLDSEIEAQRAGLGGVGTHRRGRVLRGRTMTFTGVLDVSTAGTLDLRRSVRVYVSFNSWARNTLPLKGFVALVKKVPTAPV